MKLIFVALAVEGNQEEGISLEMTFSSYANFLHVSEKCDS